MIRQLYIIFFILFATSLFAQYPGRGTYSHNLMWNEFHPATKDSIRAAATDTVITVIYPIPIDSLVDSTFTVIADSGVGGGGTANLGDTVNIRVHVDSVTIDIFQDTLRADTSKLATQYYVNDTLTAYWDTTNVKQIVSDSSQYYYWRSVSRDLFPPYPNAVPWDFNDYLTNQDSVFICTFVEASTFKSYMEFKADTLSTDSQYVHLNFEFIAPRNVSAITDTLFKLEFKTSSTDTDSVGVQLFVYEGATERYAETGLTASTSWANRAVLKTGGGGGSLSSIIAGDRFALIVRIKARYGATVNPTTWLSRLVVRWW